MKNSDNLRHNYGVILRGLLEIYRLQSCFYDDEMRIGKNRWASLCGGKTNGDVDIGELYNKTNVSKAILRGETRLEIFNYEGDEYVEQYEKCQINYEKEIIKLNKIYKDSPSEYEMIIKNKKYDRNFLRLFEYVMSLRKSPKDASVEKMKRIKEVLSSIDSKHYMATEDQELIGYKKILEEHLEIVKAVLTIKDFRK